MPIIKFEFKVNTNGETGGTFSQNFSCSKCTEFKHCTASEKRLTTECHVLKTLGNALGWPMVFTGMNHTEILYNPSSMFFNDYVKKILDTVERYRSYSR